MAAAAVSGDGRPTGGWWAAEGRASPSRTRGSAEEDLRTTSARRLKKVPWDRERERDPGQVALTGGQDWLQERLILRHLGRPHCWHEHTQKEKKL